MLPAGANPAGPMTNLRGLFNVPGGLQAIPNFTQDGNTTLTPQRMGHRNEPGSISPLNHYVDPDGSENQRNGCIFKGEDFPGITGRVTNNGEQYEFDFRFMGQIVHRDRGIIATKFWSVRDDFLTWKYNLKGYGSTISDYQICQILNKSKWLLISLAPGFILKYITTLWVVSCSNPYFTSVNL